MRHFFKCQYGIDIADIVIINIRNKKLKSLEDKL